MRAQLSGAVVNVGSSSTYKPLPLLSVYRASKAALNALSFTFSPSFKISASVSARCHDRQLYPAPRAAGSRLPLSLSTCQACPSGTAAAYAQPGVAIGQS